MTSHWLTDPASLWILILFGLALLGAGYWGGGLLHGHKSDADGGSILWPPAGVVVPYAGGSVPSNAVLCYGQAISRTAYAVLFSLIGTTYGVGDGSTTFNVPDLRGRTIIGLDNMGGSNANRINQAWARTLGGTGGEELHTLTVTESPTHSHPGTVEDNPAGGTPFTHLLYDVVLGAGTANTIFSRDVPSSGGGGAHNNVQPTMAMNYIIGAY